MKVYLDTEFVDNGRTIDLISIGLKAETGEEFYRISSEFDREKAQDHPFVGPYVLPHLPGRTLGGDVPGQPGVAWLLDTDSPLVISRARIREELEDWLWGLGGGGHLDSMPPAEGAISLWAYFASYDHVALAQLWGPMMALPSWMPKRTNDLAQKRDELGVTREDVAAVVNNQAEHDALADARWNFDLDHYLDHVAGL